MAALWLVRHAPPLVAPGTCYGRLDLPADPLRTRQAAGALAAAIPPGFALVSSPLQRCRHLAEAIAALRPELPLRQDARLAEMDFGAWEGQSWSALGAAALAPWTADFAHFAPGGGETVTAFMARVRAALADCRQRDSVWVTHAGVIRAVGLLRQGKHSVVSAGEWPTGDIAHGGWTVAEPDTRPDPQARPD